MWGVDELGRITRMGFLEVEALEVELRSENGLSAAGAKAGKARAWPGCEEVSQGAAVMVVVRI